MSLEELLKEKPELKSELDKLVEAQATSIAEQASKGLLAKNNQLLDELKPLKELKKNLGDDFDPEEYTKLKADMADKEKQGFVDKGQIDKLVEAHTKEKEQWSATYKKETEERDQAIQNLTHQLKTVIVDNELTRELAAIAKDERSLDYLTFKAKPLIETIEEDGKTIARVKDSMKGDGSYKGIKDLVSTFAEDEAYAPFVKGANANGSGAPHNSGGAGKQQENKTSTQKIADGLKQLKAG
jgi:exonuclease VII large subunit